MSKLEQALALVGRFEVGEFQAPVEAEQLIVRVFEACGHTVTQKGFVDSGAGVDCFVRTRIGDKPQLIGVEVKAGQRLCGPESVQQAFGLRSRFQFDRAMVVSRSGFSAAALEEADTVGLGQIDLFSPADLRNWLSKYAEMEIPDDVHAAPEQIIRRAMKDLAIAIAQQPDRLAQIEWRDLERVLREAFEGLGFDTVLTRSSKDGGFDLELTMFEGGQKLVYLVEVKHWTDSKPGATHLKKLIRVVASKQVTGALLLSTSGFTRTIYSGIVECSAPVRLGAGEKIVAICKAYHRLRSALWLPDESLHETLLSGTRVIGE